MAHFAKLNSKKEVVSIAVVPNAALPNDTEEEGITYLNKVWSVNNVIWKKCSYNTHDNVHALGGTPYRGNYPGVGWSYDEANDIFIAKQPYPSWTLNVSKAEWEAPVARPTSAQLDINNKGGMMRLDWEEDNARWTAYDSATATGNQDITDTQQYAWNSSTSIWDEI